MLAGISLIEYGFHPESIKELKEREVSNRFNMLINRFDDTGGKVIISRPRNLPSNPLLLWNGFDIGNCTLQVVSFSDSHEPKDCQLTSSVINRRF
jgi:hypothetical protein